MCTIAILVGVTDAPVVLAANRDELYARPTRPPERLGVGEKILVGGRDVLSGGTWLALREDGRFCAVTNQRALDLPPPPLGLRSRGLAVMECAAADDQDAYVAAIDPRRYASMNLVFGDASGVRIAYLRRATGDRAIVRLGPGIHVLANDVLGASDFPRVERLQHLIEVAIAIDPSWPALWPRLAAALGDRERVALADTPPSHLPPDLARELSAIDIRSEHYGTRSSSLVALGPGRVLAYLAADGPPSETAFTDRMGLFDA